MANGAQSRPGGFYELLVAAMACFIMRQAKAAA